MTGPTELTDRQKLLRAINTLGIHCDGGTDTDEQLCERLATALGEDNINGIPFASRHPAYKRSFILGAIECDRHAAKFGRTVEKNKRTR